jgi:hypothetical protein
LAQVESHALFLFRQTQAQGSFEYREYNRSHHHRKGYGRYNANQLDPELAGIAEKQAVVACGIDRFRSKEPSGKRTPGATDPVHAYHV